MRDNIGNEDEERILDEALDRMPLVGEIPPEGDENEEPLIIQGMDPKVRKQIKKLVKEKRGEIEAAFIERFRAKLAAEEVMREDS